MAKELDAAKKRLNSLKLEALKVLEASDMPSIRIDGYGLVYKKRNFSITVPKELEQKKQLFDWIMEHKGEETLFALQSIHSSTLNSFWKQEFEHAVEVGDVDFKIDGLDEPSVYYSIEVRKGK